MTSLDKIPSAEEFRVKIFSKDMHLFNKEEVNKLLIEFAKLHVQEALKQASQKADLKLERYTDDWYIDTDSILTAYPLNLIK